MFSHNLTLKAIVESSALKVHVRDDEFVPSLWSSSGRAGGRSPPTSCLMSRHVFNAAGRYFIGFAGAVGIDGNSVVVTVAAGGNVGVSTRAALQLPTSAKIAVTPMTRQLFEEVISR
ncbi:hypothetical protein [Lentzea xinjiangensis]|uniref:hypothetical protein n=1 Tax=Lentzea xinjiangensis TaxID=402600 RepID=UPI001160647A|nr:hypothetical protein [Lentzea xinjiangensis]